MAQSKLDTRYAFVVDYDDLQAGITRRYQLLYYLHDHTIEMYDIKNRRMFLKRCQHPALSVEDLFIGATVVVHSRQLKVTEYGDEFTRKAFHEKSESALAIIKPRGYERVGRIIKTINDAGYRIMDMNLVQLLPEEAAEFFKSQMGSSDYRTTVTDMTSYPIVLMHLVGEPDPASRFQSEHVDVYPGRRNVDFFFGPNATAKQRNNAAFNNCTLCLIKPDAIHKGVGGDILSLILDAGFEISAINVAHMTARESSEFLEVYKGVVSEYNAMSDHLTSGPIWALEVRAENAVQAFRQLCGPYDPEIARVLRPDSLRAKFGVDKVRNAVHCTDLPEDGILEVEYFFKH